MSAASGNKAIVAALLANAGIAVAKFVGFLVTSSSSMLAESVHSLVDTSNQALLLLGKKRAARPADALHPFGFGRVRYFYSFLVSLVLFSLGALFSLYEGIHKIADPHPVESPNVAFAILGVAVVLEVFSLRTAIHESRPLKGERTWWEFVRHATEPELPVVLLEDLGALVGLILALAGVALAVATGDGVWDGVGTAGIGVLLAVIAVILMIETKSLLVGEGVDAATLATIRTAVVAGDVERLLTIQTQYLGPDDLLIAAKIALTDRLAVEDVARAIDDAEERVRAVVPQVHIIFLEPDLDRARLQDTAPGPT
jgi:cation diffusion facilitator family transporter